MVSRIVTLAVVVCFGFTLVGCGDSPSGPAKLPTDKEMKPIQPMKKFNVNQEDGKKTESKDGEKPEK